tara:strand:+ start:601 stop:1164 length:564 start_codon:yes stop_codon:yes gene_type:complete
MISVRIFNKKADRCLIFLHGLFANEGFWLNYLKYFKNFKVVIANLPYESNFSPKEYGFEIEQIIKREKINYAVCHSLGCLIGRFIENRIKCFFICDIFDSKRINRKKFLNEISSRTNISNHKVNKKLLEVDKNIQALKNENFVHSKSKSFFPDKDCYFTYFSPANFRGNHFEINSAMIEISKELDNV